MSLARKVSGIMGTIRWGTKRTTCPHFLSPKSVSRKRSHMSVPPDDFQETSGAEAEGGRGRGGNTQREQSNDQCVQKE